MTKGDVDMSETDSFDYSKIDAVFYKYANRKFCSFWLINLLLFLVKEDKHLCGEGGRIGPNGMQKLLDDIKVPADNINALILAWRFEAEVQCEFSLKEFRQGFRKLG